MPRALHDGPQASVLTNKLALSDPLAFVSYHNFNRIF
jgi:hypothetical protein